MPAVAGEGFDRSFPTGRFSGVVEADDFGFAFPFGNHCRGFVLRGFEFQFCDSQLLAGLRDGDLLFAQRFGRELDDGLLDGNQRRLLLDQLGLFGQFHFLALLLDLLLEFLFVELRCRSQTDRRGDLSWRFDSGDQRLHDLDSQFVAGLSHRRLEFLLEFHRRLALDEVATKFAGAFQPTDAACVRQDHLANDLLVDEVAILILVVSHENFRRLFGTDAELNAAIERDPETVLRRETHVLLLGQIESLAAAVHFADPGHIRIHEVRPRIKRPLLNAAFTFFDQQFVRSFRERPGQVRDDSFEAGGNRHRFMLTLNLEQVRIDRVPPRFEHFRHDPFRLGFIFRSHLREELAVRQIVTGETDFHTQFAGLDLDERLDLPVIVIRVDEVAAGREHFPLNPFVEVVRGDFIQVRQFLTGLPNEHGKLIRPNIDAEHRVGHPGEDQHQEPAGKKQSRHLAGSARRLLGVF